MLFRETSGPGCRGREDGRERYRHRWAQGRRLSSLGLALELCGARGVGVGLGELWLRRWGLVHGSEGLLWWWRRPMGRCLWPGQDTGTWPGHVFFCTGVYGVAALAIAVRIGDNANLIELLCAGGAQRRA